MKYTINERGYLKRGEKYVRCPMNGELECGRWCPLFREWEGNDRPDAELKVVQLHCASTPLTYEVE